MVLKNMVIRIGLLPMVIFLAAATNGGGFGRVKLDSMQDSRLAEANIFCSGVREDISMVCALRTTTSRRPVTLSNC